MKSISTLLKSGSLGSDPHVLKRSNKHCTLQGINISHLGKFGKSSTQNAIKRGDMLVSWVYVYKSKIDTYICTDRKDMIRYGNIWFWYRSANIQFISFIGSRISINIYIYIISMLSLFHFGLKDSREAWNDHGPNFESILSSQLETRRNWQANWWENKPPFKVGPY